MSLSAPPALATALLLRRFPTAPDAATTQWLETVSFAELRDAWSACTQAQLRALTEALLPAARAIKAPLQLSSASLDQGAAALREHVGQDQSVMPMVNHATGLLRAASRRATALAWVGGDESRLAFGCPACGSVALNLSLSETHTWTEYEFLGPIGDGEAYPLGLGQRADGIGMNLGFDVCSDAGCVNCDAAGLLWGMLRLTGGAR